MNWAILALLTAVFESGKDVLGKRVLGKWDPVAVAWGWRVFALPFLFPLLMVAGLPPLGPDFAWALLAGGSLNLISSVFYMRAIRHSDLSLVVPLVAFTPLFLLLTSPLLLGETPGGRGIAGVVLIVLGSYLMKAGDRGKGYLAPFRALLREPGGRWMLAVSLIWSVTSNIDKIGVRNSSPVFWAVAVNLFVAVGLAPAALRRGRRMFCRNYLRALFPLGAAGGLGTACQMAAINLTLVPYVIAVKRTSTVMTVLWGHLLFREDGLRERLGGALLMLAGMVLIILP